MKATLMFVALVMVSFGAAASNTGKDQDHHPRSKLDLDYQKPSPSRQDYRQPLNRDVVRDEKTSPPRDTTPAVVPLLDSRGKTVYAPAVKHRFGGSNKD